MGWRFKWGTCYEDNMLACLEMRTSQSFYTWSQILIFLTQGEGKKKKERCHKFFFKEQVWIPEIPLLINYTKELKPGS